MVPKIFGAFFLRNRGLVCFLSTDSPALVNKLPSVYAFLCVLSAVPAFASGPDYLTFGGGGFDFDKHDSERHSADYRGEYEWGTSLLPALADSFNGAEPIIQLHPTVGLEGNSNNAFYANGGLNLDIPLLWRRGIFTWGEAAGYFNRGNDPRTLGSPLEFRSQLELGWRFPTEVRVTAYISHISNAHISTVNPGAEILGAYLHLPLWWEQK